jgi:hypothetical protein
MSVRMLSKYAHCLRRRSAAGRLGPGSEPGAAKARPDTAAILAAAGTLRAMCGEIVHNQAQGTRKWARAA